MLKVAKMCRQVVLSYFYMTVPVHNHSIWTCQCLIIESLIELELDVDDPLLFILAAVTRDANNCLVNKSDRLLKRWALRVDGACVQLSALLNIAHIYIVNYRVHSLFVEYLGGFLQNFHHLCGGLAKK